MLSTLFQWNEQIETLIGTGKASFALRICFRFWLVPEISFHPTAQLCYNAHKELHHATEKWLHTGTLEKLLNSIPNPSPILDVLRPIAADAKEVEEKAPILFGAKTWANCLNRRILEQTLASNKYSLSLF